MVFKLYLFIHFSQIFFSSSLLLVVLELESRASYTSLSKENVSVNFVRNSYEKMITRIFPVDNDKHNIDSFILVCTVDCSVW